MTRVIEPAAARQRQFAPRDFHGQRHEVLGTVQLEIVDLHRDGEFRDRIAQHQRFLELSFLVRGGKFREHLAGVIALAIIEFGRQPVRE